MCSKILYMMLGIGRHINLWLQYIAMWFMCLLLQRGVSGSRICYYTQKRWYCSGQQLRLPIYDLNLVATSLNPFVNSIVSGNEWATLLWRRGRNCFNLQWNLRLSQNTRNIFEICSRKMAYVLTSSLTGHLRKHCWMTASCHGVNKLYQTTWTGFFFCIGSLQFWGFHSANISSRGLLGCDTM
jgi:hypothetical protein